MRVDFMRSDLANALAILNFNDFQNIVWATGVPSSQFPPPDAPRSEHVDAILDYIDLSCAGNFDRLVSATYGLGVESLGSMNPLPCNPSDESVES
jgi:hypothetical protein